MKGKRILIVEDETALAEGLKFNFELEGYSVTLAGDGHTALRHFESAQSPIDLVILDVMLPGMSGYETCRKLRELDQIVPILTLSARSLSEDRTLAFDAGTDQYLMKPFALPELLSRVRNLLSRGERTTNGGQRPPAEAESKELRKYAFGDVEVDFEQFELSVRGTMHRLTTQEVELLRYFVRLEGKVLSRYDILEDVWIKNPDVTVRTVDNFVLRLRKLIELDPKSPRHLLSVRGTGYRFVANPASRDASGDPSV